MLQGNPEVARRAESCGGFLPGPGARVRLGLTQDCVVGRQGVVSTPLHCHQPGPILHSQTSSRNLEAMWSSSTHCPKGETRPEEGGRSWREWSRARRPSQSAWGLGWRWGVLRGPREQDGAQHLSDSPHRLRRPLGRAGTLLGMEGL